MPVDMSKYPPEWPEIRARILARAQDKCERCGIGNGWYRFRWYDEDGPGESWHRYASNADAVGLPAGWHGWDAVDEDGEPVGVQWYDNHRPSRVVLTIAHIHDPDPQNCADDNLQALCQSCHNRLDAPMRARHAAETRRRKRLAETGQGELPL